MLSDSSSESIFCLNMGWFWIIICIEKLDLCYPGCYLSKIKKPIAMYKTLTISFLILWELTGSNRRPSACKADALNQLS